MCARLAPAGRDRGLVLVPGGGASADVVRDLDARFGLQPSSAHWMAVLAMDQYGLLLADLTPGAEVVRSIDEARERLDGGSGVVVLLPSEPLRTADPLPHSWSVTSDSIAAWLTGQLHSRLLVLLKDRHGMAVLTAALADGAPGVVTRAEIAASRGVDGHLAELLGDASFDLWAIDGDHPERLTELLETGNTQGVRLAPRVP
ncbi:MAG: hypothetical protein IH629_05780 [Thermoleophilia bacterium]|nr:hypothetical protein [Thermoleophilia bacterium]